MIQYGSAQRTIRRPGFGLVELAMTGVLVAAAMVATLQVVGWFALERRASERRERAIVEASNVMERVVARPYETILSEDLATIRLNESAASFLHGSKLDLKVDSFDDAPARKRITVEVRWLDRSGRPEAPVRLLAWSYRGGVVTQ
jgi:hypothetical protein